jgi:hypothetical protein
MNHMNTAWPKIIAIILLSGIISCKNEDEPTPEKPLAVNDSSLIVKPQTSDNPYVTVDVSPMDMSYFPVEYPKLKMANNKIPPPVAKVTYSRPHLGGRHLFNDVLKLGEPWRLGANESTEIELYQTVSIFSEKVKKGRYSLYCIPDTSSWTIVFNSNTDVWGLKQDTTKDVFRFPVTAVHNHNAMPLEYFTIMFEKTDKGADMFMGWGDITARLPMEF